MKKDVLELMSLQLRQNVTAHINETYFKLYDTDSLIKAFQSSRSLSQEVLDYARENKIPIINFTTCENILREKNILMPNEQIFINQVEFLASKYTNNQNISNGPSVLYNFFSTSSNNFDIDVTSCNKTKMLALIPIDAEQLGINITNILELESNVNFSLFSQQEEFFNDVCYSFVSNSSNVEMDTTVSLRRELYYQNLTIECVSGDENLNCTLVGIDRHGFVQCECDFSGNLEISVNYKESIFDDFLRWNANIILCFNKFCQFVINLIFRNCLEEIQDLFSQSQLYQ